MMTRLEWPHSTRALSVPAWLLLALTVLGSVAASATTWGRMTLETACRQADLVVRARAADQAVERDARGLIWTTQRFEIMEQLHGPTVARVEVRQLGGTIDGVTQVVAGMPVYRADEELVLFLQGWGDGWYGVLNGPQGALPVVGDEMPSVSAAFPEAETADLREFLTLVRAEFGLQEGSSR